MKRGFSPPCNVSSPKGDEEDVAGTFSVDDRLLVDASEETGFAVFTILLNGYKGEDQLFGAVAVGTVAVEEVEDVERFFGTIFFPAGDIEEKVPLPVAVVVIFFAEK